MVFKKIEELLRNIQNVSLNNPPFFNYRKTKLFKMLNCVYLATRYVDILPFTHILQCIPKYEKLPNILDIHVKIFAKTTLLNECDTQLLALFISLIPYFATITYYY